jgi:hypothetical protein
MPNPSHNGDTQDDVLRHTHLENEGAADRHGRAALLLVESLMHSLIDKGVITRGEAIDVIDIATEVEAELAGGSNGELDGTLLAPLAKSFRIEAGSRHQPHDGDL